MKSITLEGVKFKNIDFLLIIDRRRLKEKKKQ